MKKFNEFIAEDYDEYGMPMGMDDDDDDENEHSEGEYGYEGDMALGLNYFLTT